MRVMVLLTLCATIAACGPSAIVSRGSDGAGPSATVMGEATRAIPTATSAPLPAGYDLVSDLDALPFHFPCERDLVGGEARGSAAYVPGPRPQLLGCITDARGKGIEAAYTEVPVEGAAATMTAVGWGPTGADGRYIAPGIVEPGWYDVVAGASGYTPTKKRVWVDPTRTTVVDFVLEPKE